ncbi:YggT family protein [Thiosulfativibrio zosterae]|uniref:Membrane protein n=1 Tax=Thiosulfativibrio zosterae TaxID=2675053 RepID=A0A6F8PKN7_9GAMM|nr:YggT family protein [Thiosulfativibrio zosterae]BBP42617.1 membrane protein [Thiosulfativibrio zosterae]
MEATPLTQGGLFLIQFIAGLVIFTLMLRFLMRATHVDWRHPVVHFVAKVTNPLCAPVNKVLTIRGRWDWSAIITAMLLQALVVIALGWLTGRNFGVGLIAISSITEVANQLLDMAFWLIIINVIISWISPGYNPNTAIFVQMTQPILAPFQKLVPPIGGFDLSPIIAILAIKLTQIVVVGGIAQYGQMLVTLG